MTLLDILTKKQIEALKSKDTLLLSVLRFLISAIKNKQIELRGNGVQMTDEDILKVVKKQIKERNVSIESYTQGNRMDLVEKEKLELQVLETLLNELETK